MKTFKHGDLVQDDLTEETYVYLGVEEDEDTRKALREVFGGGVIHMLKPVRTKKIEYRKKIGRLSRIGA